MDQEFDNWNCFKKLIHRKKPDNEFNFHQGDVWWTALGVNIGKEINGKNETFERPTLILKVINNNSFAGKLSKEAFIRAQYFSVEKSILEYEKVFREII